MGENQELLGGVILLVIGVVVLFGTEAGTTVAFLIVLIVVVGVFLAFPEVGLILFIILIVALIIRRLKVNSRSNLEGAEKQTDDEVGGCLMMLLGYLLALPGGITVFIMIIMNDYEMWAALAWLACILVGVRLIGIGSNS